MYSELNIKWIQQKRPIIFKVLKPEMYVITKENSLLRRRKKEASL